MLWIRIRIRIGSVFRASWIWIRIQIGPKSWIRIQIQCIWIHKTVQHWIKNTGTYFNFECLPYPRLSALLWPEPGFHGFHHAELAFCGEGCIAGGAGPVPLHDAGKGYTELGRDSRMNLQMNKEQDYKLIILQCCRSKIILFCYGSGSPLYKLQIRNWE